MVALILPADLRVAYFGLHADGLPKLAVIDAAVAKNCKAIAFFLARPLTRRGSDSMRRVDDYHCM